MIDFPASPTTGQIFNAPSGITYRWTGTLWIATGASAGGDFMAMNDAAYTPVVGVVPFANVKTGNAGGWFNTSNNRYTPPAGRYSIAAGVNQYATSGGSMDLYLRKNGVMVCRNYQTINTGVQNTNDVDGVFDASGTDYFDVYIASLGGSGYSGGASVNYFSAFPISGIQGPPGPPGSVPTGDFYAYFPTVGLASTATTPINFPNIVGNSGGWFNNSNGRYTPPAGRYRIFGSTSGGLTAGGVNFVVTLRKNGTAIFSGMNTSAAGSYRAQASVDGVFDTNGTDWFDIQAQASGAANDLYGPLWFGAYPISGIKGPQGDPGTFGTGFRLISRVVPTAGQASIDFTNLPSDINDLELRFDLLPTTNAQHLVMRFYDSAGVIDSTAGRYFFSPTASYHTMAAGTGAVSAGSGASANAIILNYSVASNMVSNVYGIRGHAMLNNIRDAARLKTVNWQCQYQSDGGAVFQVAGGGQRNLAGMITGLQLLFHASTVAAGGAISLWGSP